MIAQQPRAAAGSRPIAGPFTLLSDRDVVAFTPAKRKASVYRPGLTSLASAQVVASRAAAGLVSVSTSSEATPVPVQWAENCITIDRVQARITRLRKGVGVGAKCLHNQGPVKQNMFMLTLTYRGDNRDWCPKQISQYLANLRAWHKSAAGSTAMRYVWVAELQERGVVHYHVVLWVRPGLTPPKPDSAWRSASKGVQPPMWSHGMSNRIKARAPVAYLMKYLSKITQKNVGVFPYGARLFGLGGLDSSGAACKRWVLWPAYVQGNASVSDRFRPAQGGGYINAETGQLLLSEFAPTGGGFTSFIRVRTTPRLLDASGPFSWASDDRPLQSVTSA